MKLSFKITSNDITIPPVVYVTIVFIVIISFLFTVGYYFSETKPYSPHWLLPRSTTAANLYPDSIKPGSVYINLVHEPSGFCEDLRYNYDYGGELQQTCWNEQHWRVIIRGYRFNLTELEIEIRKAGDKKRNAAGFSEVLIMLNAEKGVPYKVLKQILAVCARAGFSKVELVMAND